MATTMITAESTPKTTSPAATTTCSKEEPGVETQLLAEQNSVDAVAVIQNKDASDAGVTASTSSVKASPTSTVAWSECLASQNRGDVFSPAKEMADKESLHGVGLLKALDRSKLEARADRRCSLMLLESASCYEKFGVALQKAIQLAQAHPSLEVGDAALSSVLPLAEQTRQLATRLRADIGTPLQEFAGAHAETVPAITQKYTASRQRAYEARQRALLARQKYLKAVQQAEEACNSVKEQLTNVETTTSNSDKDSNNIKWEQQLEAYGKLQGQEAADRVAHLMGDVKVLQRRYESLVEKENEAVKFAHNIEAICLESLEKLEEQLLSIFYDSLVRTFQEIKTCIDELVVLSTTSDSNNDKEEAIKLVQQQRKGDFFTTFLKVGSSQPEKTGVADAETLGLSEEVGKLRDEVQSLIAARIERIKKVKFLAAFFEDIAAASEKLGHGLQQVVKHEDSYVSSKGTPVEHLKTLMNSCEGPRTLSLWSNLMKTLEREAEAIHQFARSLKNIKASKLDHFLFTDEKNLKDEAEMDDGRWKHLCDAARTEMRADAKYRQSTAQTAKARERIRSVDMETTAGNEKTTKSPQKVNRAMNGMNKAFGNFLSILPDGGEQAMQMLAPEKRRAVAERSLQEADEKESKGKQALDSAVAFKHRVMETYKTKAEPLVKKYELEEISGAEDIEAATQSLVASVETLRSSRYECLGPMSEKLVGEKPLATALLDLQEWTQITCDEIASENTPCEDTEKTSATSGFMLSFVVAESDGVLDFARIGKTDSFESDCFDGASDKDDASTNSCPAVQVSGQDSSRSLDLGAVKNDEGTGQAETAETPVASNGQPTSRWLQKSFSTPMAKPSFKTFRKFQSMNENGKENDEADATDDLTETSTVSTTVPPQNSRESFETEFFMAFWPDYEGTPPGVTDSFACAFLPKDCTVKDVGSIEHGRLFLTHKAAVFVAWRGRKAIIQYSLMTGAEKHDSHFGLSDDTLLVTAQSGNSQQSTLLLGCFSYRDNALEIIQGRIVKAKKARAAAMAAKKETTRDSDDANSETPTSDATPVPPDTTIPKMEVVLSKKIRGVAMDKFHDLVWLDKAGGGPFYGSWLGRGSCFDINIGDWETSDHVGTWCGEKYTHKRNVTFKLKRNSMIGPPVAGVSQAQYCRLEGKDRSVMHMTVAFEGIPYSDTFSVEVRWVATRSGTKDIAVQVGVFVQFHKSTLLKSQIRNGTMTETKPVHESLFEFVKTALGEEGAADDEGEEEDDNYKTSGDKEDAVQQDGLLAALTANLSDVVKDNMNIAVPIAAILFVFILWRVFLSAPSVTSEITTLNAKVASLENEVKLMRQSIEELTQLLKKQSGK